MSAGGANRDVRFIRALVPDARYRQWLAAWAPCTVFATLPVEDEMRESPRKGAVMIRESRERCTVDRLRRERVTTVELMR